MVNLGDLGLTADQLAKKREKAEAGVAAALRAEVEQAPDKPVTASESVAPADTSPVPLKALTADARVRPVVRNPSPRNRALPRDRIWSVKPCPALATGVPRAA